MRQLAVERRLPLPQLVEDLARLCIAPVVDLGCLEGREHVERLDGDLRPEGEGLERDDDRIAAEERREPWYTGGDVALPGPRPLVDEEAEVRDASGDRQVEELVVGRNRGRAAGPR